MVRKYATRLCRALPKIARHASFGAMWTWEFFACYISYIPAYSQDNSCSELWNHWAYYLLLAFRLIYGSGCTSTFRVIYGSGTMGGTNSLTTSSGNPVSWSTSRSNVNPPQSPITISAVVKITYNIGEWMSCFFLVCTALNCNHIALTMSPTTWPAMVDPSARPRTACRWQESPPLANVPTRELSKPKWKS